MKFSLVAVDGHFHIIQKQWTFEYFHVLSKQIGIKSEKYIEYGK